MKIKKTFIVVIIAIVSIAVVTGIAMKLLSRENEYGLKTSGSLYENIAEFDMCFHEDEDELVKSFLNGVEYEIVSVNKEDMTATIDITIPVISSELSDVIDKVIEKNTEKEYEELKNIAERELSNLLEANKFEKEKTTVVLMIEEVDGEYKLIPTEEWNRILVKNLEDLYMDYLKILIGEITDEVPN